jgi:AraC-like DNA-binding protein
VTTALQFAAPYDAEGLRSARRHGLEVRPGLTLHWNYGPAPAFPGPAASYLVFRLSTDGGWMRLFQEFPVCERPGAAPEFHAVIALAPLVLDELFPDIGGGGHAQGEARPLTPAARLALQSIRCCPFVGACRGMALSARCHDLLVEFLSAFTSEPSVRPSRPLASVTDRIRTAAGILHRNLEHPPSVDDLASQAGLSETTLKRGFSQVFNTTVYGYVRSRRMEHAQRLLESGAATVLEAATLVGYSNPSNFAAAFRRQFGVNPKAFQLGLRSRE